MNQAQREDFSCCVRQEKYTIHSSTGVQQAAGYTHLEFKKVLR